MADLHKEAEARVPPRSPAPRCFRVLHLFSGRRRPRGVEWWLLVLATRAQLHMEVLSVDVEACPQHDLSHGP
eukprot:7910871-Alexandrium_andersonii.AAC.1